jgi:glycosyltransferase involved in cell wall biosynthesis
MKSSIIIPTYNRQELTDRAIQSILSSKGSLEVQIIVVDDNSCVPFISKYIRPQDLIIWMAQNGGANVCRAEGLKKAIGEVIYFLDSDDYIIERDFDKNYEIVLENPNNLYYCEYSGYNIKGLPEQITKEEYFDFIFNRYPGIANTCTLCFSSKIMPHIDRSLPRHQDWDLVYFSFLKKNIIAKKIPGKVFIDRSDKRSISRNRNFLESLPWLEKLREENYDIFCYACYFLLSKYPECLPLFKFIGLSLRFLSLKKINLTFILKRTIQRLL